MYEYYTCKCTASVLLGTKCVHFLVHEKYTSKYTKYKV